MLGSAKAESEENKLDIAGLSKRSCPFGKKERPFPLFQRTSQNHTPSAVLGKKQTTKKTKTYIHGKKMWFCLGKGCLSCVFLLVFLFLRHKTPHPLGPPIGTKAQKSHQRSKLFLRPFGRQQKHWTTACNLTVDGKCCLFSRFFSVLF